MGSLIARSAIIAFVGGGLILLPGCKKKDQAAESPTAPSTPAAAETPPENGLPGASDVRAALANQDYTSAVERLIALKPLAVGDAYADYRALSGEVGLKLSEAAKTDPKAAEALATYRMSLTGR